MNSKQWRVAKNGEYLIFIATLDKHEIWFLGVEWLSDLAQNPIDYVLEHVHKKWKRWFSELTSVLR